MSEGRYRCRRCAYRADTQAELVEHATDADHPICSTCPRSLLSLEPVCCDLCLQRCRDDLTLIVEAVALAPEVIEAAGYRNQSPPGGDLFVMVNDGNAATPQRPNVNTEPVTVTATAHLERPEIPGISETQSYWRRGLISCKVKGCTETDLHQHTTIASTAHSAFVEERIPSDGREHVKDHWKSDPTAVIAPLEAWQRDWRYTFGQPPAGDYMDATVVSCVAYLQKWLMHAGRYHESIDMMVKDVRELRVRLTHMVGIANDPVISPARCIDCNGPLISPYRPAVYPQPPDTVRKGVAVEGRDMAGSPDEPEPVYECRDCLMIYDPLSYRLAIRAAVDATVDLQAMMTG